MRNLNFLKLFYGLMLVMLSTAFTSCVDDNDDTEAPFLEVSPTTLNFGSDGQPASGSQASFTISTNRAWKAIVPTDKSWVTLSQEQGEGTATIEVSIPEGINDEATVTIEISNKVGVLMSEAVTIKSGNLEPNVLIYKETFGTEGTAEYPYPFVDTYQGWVKTGEGSSTVEYTGKAASLRNKSNASDGYEGASGSTKLFFGNTAEFVINKITLKENQKNLMLNFGGAYYDGTTKDDVFKPEQFHVYLSANGTTWTPIDYTTAEAKNGWVYATANFTLKNSVEFLYIKFTADIASMFSLDDPSLSTGNGGNEIDLENGGGSGTLPETLTIPELIQTISAEQAVLDNEADHYLIGVVQSDVEGGNYTNNNLVIATENATTAGNGILLFGSQVDPKTLNVKRGDKVKITLHKGKAQTVNYQGVYEITGGKDDQWATVEKIGTASIKPIEITPNDLASYQSMTVTIKEATPKEPGVWGVNSPYTFTAGGQDFAVFCRADAAAFQNQPFAAVKANITGIVTLYKGNAQIAPRNMEDVAGFASQMPTIISATPREVNFKATGGSEDITLEVVNMGDNTLTVTGLSGILGAIIEGTKITVTAQPNTTASAIEQTLKVTVANGNSIDIPVTVAAPTAGGGYSMISTLADLKEGKYFMAGYAEVTSDKTDLTPYTYQIWTGEVSGKSGNSDLVTVSYQYESNNLVPKEESKVAGEMELIAVTGKPNTYYIKVGDKYLYNSATATNRRLYFKDTAEDTEWVFIDKSNGTGVVGSNNNTHLISASATANYIRAYKNEAQTKFGLFFFKKN